jgi:quercetin dioxygenase-like cupin family protein
MLLGAPAVAQAAPAPAARPFGVCVPMSQRAGRDVGCFIITERDVGELRPGSVFWHLTRFATRDEAQAARGENGTVVEAFGQVWLLTIADSSWHERAGTHVATIGPLPVDSGTSYSALYMEASMRPGMKSSIHRHPGPEAWYTLSGQTCLETPAGAMTGRAGGPPVIIPGGPPMELTATGTDTRRSIVLILHESSQRPAIMVSDWTPRGLCRR